MSKIALPKMLESVSHDYDCVYYDETLGNMDDVEIIVGYPKDLIENIKKYPSLKLVHLVSAGFDYVDLETLKNHGVEVYNARGVYSIPIAEYILGHLLSLTKQIPYYRDRQSQQLWEPQTSYELFGRSALFLGAGDIAQETSKRLRGFGVTTDGTNRKGNQIETFNHVYPLDTINDLLPNYDIVINTLPANDHTIHILNTQTLRLMKKDAILINIGRGNALCTEDLVEILDSHLNHVILDVFEEEPLPKNHPLWMHPKVILTPHCSGRSNAINSRLFNLIEKNINAFTRKEIVTNKII
ncbi:MAG: D-2-hydroxyacid dehydrogenase [Erysipelothrix sp.]